MVESEERPLRRPNSKGLLRSEGKHSEIPFVVSLFDSLKTRVGVSME